MTCDVSGDAAGFADDQIREVTGIRNQREVDVIERDAWAVEAALKKPLASCRDLRRIGIDTKNDQFTLFGELESQLAVPTAQNEAEALFDASLLQDGLGLFLRVEVRDDVGRCQTRQTGLSAKYMHAARRRAHDEMSVGCRQSACFAVHGGFPGLFARFGVDGDHFVFSACEKDVACEDQGRLMRRIERPFHTSIGE